MLWQSLAITAFKFQLATPRIDVSKAGPVCFIRLVYWELMGHQGVQPGPWHRFSEILGCLGMLPKRSQHDGTRWDTVPGPAEAQWANWWSASKAHTVHMEKLRGAVGSIKLKNAIYTYIYIIFVCCFYYIFLFEVWKRFEMSWNVNSHRIKNDFGRLGFCEARSWCHGCHGCQRSEPKGHPLAFAFARWWRATRPDVEIVHQRSSIEHRASDPKSKGWEWYENG